MTIVTFTSLSFPSQFPLHIRHILVILYLRHLPATWTTSMSSSEGPTSSNSADSTPLPLAVGADGRVECPECHDRVGVGVAGLANLKRHMESEKCAKQAKRNKENQRILQQRQLAKSYFTGPPKVPSLVSRPPRIHSTITTPLQPSTSTLAPKPTGIRPPDTSQAADLPSTSSTIACLTSFKARIIELEQDFTIPEAGINHELAAFSANPEGCVGKNEDAWEKWDGPLNTLLQKEPSELRKLVVRGKRGLIGLHDFLLYLVVNHGVQGVLFEGKIGRVMSAIDDV